MTAGVRSFNKTVKHGEMADLIIIDGEKLSYLKLRKC